MNMNVVTVLKCLCVLTISTSVSNLNVDDIPHMILAGVKKLQATQEIPEIFDDQDGSFNRMMGVISGAIYCETCDFVVDQVIHYRKSGANKESMATLFRDLCNGLVGWGAEACSGYVDIEIDTILFIIDKKEDLTAIHVCSILFHNRGCLNPDAKIWNISLPPSDVIQQTQENDHRTNNTTTEKILHLTDFHYDPLYRPGNNAACGLPLCCQESNGPSLYPLDSAGYWGDYHVCDTPWHTITDFMQYVNNTHRDVDFVYYTGDIISHRSWGTSKADNTKAIQELLQLFNDTFKTIPVYPVLGNHESHPSDFFSPGNITDSVTTQWVFDVVAKEWSRWLPAAAQDTIKKGGYYTVLVRSGFRIIALNSNVCYTSNLWLIFEDEDPYDQLKWLVEVLTEAEKNAEKVHILSHIPPGETECLQQWASQFINIINRFAHIIVAQFNGHTHIDELRLFPSPNNPEKIINIAFNGGSFTSFVGFNPNYRIYLVDGIDYTVQDYDHYVFNLDQANENQLQSPEWYKLYSFKGAYDLTGMSLDNFEDLLKRMSSDEALLEKYFRYGGRESPYYSMVVCADECLDNLLCRITAVAPKDALLC